MAEKRDIQKGNIINEKESKASDRIRSIEFSLTSPTVRKPFQVEDMFQSIELFGGLGYYLITGCKEKKLNDFIKSKIKIPTGTQHGKQFRLKGKGMPILRRSVFGDLYIRIITQVPTSLSKRQKEILEEFNELETNKPDPVIKSFFEKAKKFWKSS